jgi:peptide/nickel transport system ATP-binding protein/oligopeptide transport system ATP-binding protein
VTPATAPLVEAEGLVKHFVSGGFFSRRHAAIRAVDGVSFAIRSNETLGLVGESGCGKSTTGRLLLKLIESDAGSIRFRGRDLTRLRPHELQARRRDFQLVFQDPYSSLNPRMSVREILREPLIVHGVTAGGDIDRQVDEMLDHVGLSPSYARRFPHEFSGSQRQRVGIARALILQPQLVVCDEPVSALDVSVQAQILNLLGELKARFGLSYLFISHDLNVVRHMADRVAVMYLGRIVETAAASSLFKRPAHPYTRALIEAIPVPNPHYRRTKPAIEGDVPSPAAPPSGCHFNTRCPFATPRCRSEAPQAIEIAPGHSVACHRASELPPWSALAAPSASELGNERIRRLHAKFRQPRQAAGQPPADGAPSAIPFVRKMELMQ